MASKLVPAVFRTASRCARSQRSFQWRSFTASTNVASDALQVHRDSPENNPNIPFNVNETSQKLIDIVLTRYPPQYKKAAVMPVMDILQRQNGGFCSISVMNKVAELLEMPPMRVYEGRFHLQVCTTTPCQLGGCGSDKIMETIENELGIKPGHTTEDGIFTFTEVECLGACVNAPMLDDGNDNYYEDLTPESTLSLLKAMRATAEQERAANGAYSLESPHVTGGAGSPKEYVVGKVKLPASGPQSGRKTCENSAGITTLTGEPWGPEVFRKDGEL